MRVHTSGAEPEIDFTGGLKKRNIREFLGGVLTNAVRSTVFRGNVDRGESEGVCAPRRIGQFFNFRTHLERFGMHFWPIFYWKDIIIFLEKFHFFEPIRTGLVGV